MTGAVSDNAKAILLLTAPLLVGRSRGADAPLTLSQYNRVARRLHELDLQPADLLGAQRDEVLSELQLELENASESITQLLERGLLLAQAIEHWQQRAIWVVSRADDGYPIRLKKRLGLKAPAVLYGCGSQALLESGGLAVVGSRDADKELLKYTEGISKLAARAECSIVSGAARGVDQAAMAGAMRVGGRAVGILADNLEREVLNAEHRDGLLEDSLVLVSPYDPKAGFDVGNAMARNKLIYALADAALVVESAHKQGGTWYGAVEQLDKLRLVPVYTRSTSTGKPSHGLQGLLRKGAREWPNPGSPEAFKALLADVTAAGEAEIATQPSLIPMAEEQVDALGTGGSAVDPSAEPQESAAAAPRVSSADALFGKFEELLSEFPAPLSLREVTARFEIGQRQAQVWLNRLVSEGKYQKRSKSASYVRAAQESDGVLHSHDADVPPAKDTA